MSTRTTTSREPVVSVSKCRHHGGTAPGGFLDFSAPLNPLGTPGVIRELIAEAVSSGAYGRYPDYEYGQLRGAIAEFYGVDPEGVLPLNGASEALYLLVLSLRPTSLVAFEPTFGDHRCLSEAIGLKMTTVLYRESGDGYELPMEPLPGTDISAGGKTIVVLSNPNNPTGAVLSKSQLEYILDTYAESVVLVDEAYRELCHLCESAEAIDLADSYENLVVVRSLTKAFAVPGLRVGFLYTSNARLLESVEASRPPWNVNSLADMVFTRAFREHSTDLKSFLSLSREVVRSESDYLSRSLRSVGLRVYNPSAPYVLVKHPDVPSVEVLRLLEKRRVYFRDASGYPGLTPYHARISVRLRHENDMLIAAYREVLRYADHRED